MASPSGPWLKIAWNNGSRRLLVATLFFLGCMAILVATAVLTLISPGKYNPLGDYPVQRVTGSDFSGRDASALGLEVLVKAHGTVYVTGTKCSNANQDVPVRGVVRWRRVDPPGKLVTVSRGNGVRTPGCTVANFENDVPEEVTADVLRHGPSTWQINGEEVPLDLGGKEGVPRYWETQNFKVIP